MTPRLVIALACMVAALGGCATWSATSDTGRPAAGSASPTTGAPAAPNAFEPSPQHYFGTGGP